MEDSVSDMETERDDSDCQELNGSDKSPSLSFNCNSVQGSNNDLEQDRDSNQEFTDTSDKFKDSGDDDDDFNCAESHSDLELLLQPVGKIDVLAIISETAHDDSSSDGMGSDDVEYGRISLTSKKSADGRKNNNNNIIGEDDYSTSKSSSFHGHDIAAATASSLISSSRNETMDTGPQNQGEA